MADERPAERVASPCRWRTSAETLDLIEALERIEALLVRLNERVLPTVDRMAADRGLRRADTYEGKR
jgi:hypothetical protein